MYLALGIAEAKEEVVHTTGVLDLGRELLVGIHRTCAANLGCTNNRTVLGVKTQGYGTRTCGSGTDAELFCTGTEIYAK